MSIIGAAAIGAGGGIIGGAMSHSSAKSAQKRAFRQTKQIMQNKTQWAVEDLKKAGINPLLAAGNVSGGSPSMSPAQTPDFASAISSGVSAGTSAVTAKEQRNLLKEQQKQSQSVAELNSALASKAQAEARLADANAGKAEVVRSGYTAIAPTVDKLANSISEHLNKTDSSTAKKLLPKVKSGSAYERNVITPIVDAFQRLLDPNYSATHDFVTKRSEPKPKPKPKKAKKPKHQPKWEFK